MTDANIFQIFGLTYLAIGLGMLVNPRFYREMLAKMIDDQAVLFLTGLLVFALGCLLVFYHNVWASGWTVLITVFGWLALSKGLMMVVIPEQSVKLYGAVKISGGQLALYGIIVFALGMVFAYLGWFIL